MKKEKILNTINQMGKEVDINVFLERLIFIDKIEKGLIQVENQEIISRFIGLSFDATKLCANHPGCG